MVRSVLHMSSNNSNSSNNKHKKKKQSPNKLTKAPTTTSSSLSSSSTPPLIYSSLPSCGHTVTPEFVDFLEETYGPGVTRFAPSQPERSLAHQRAELSAAELQCLGFLRRQWQATYHSARHPHNNTDDNDDDETEEDGIGVDQTLLDGGDNDNDSSSTTSSSSNVESSTNLSTTALLGPAIEEVLLRFARNTPGRPFRGKAAWKILHKVPASVWKLNARALETQLKTKTLFPLPGLRTLRGNHEVFYMRPSRFVVNQTKTSDVIDNLVYVMNSMVELEDNATKGIAFLAYMKDWQMRNFATDYWWQLLMMLQGRVGTRVTLFLIVQPPAWFGKVWKIMKPMMAPSFRTRVHMISETALDQFLQPNYAQFLPDEMTGGKVPTTALVQDFVTYRQVVEDGRRHHYAPRRPKTTPLRNTTATKLSKKTSALLLRHLTPMRNTTSPATTTNATSTTKPSSSLYASPLAKSMGKSWGALSNESIHSSLLGRGDHSSSHYSQSSTNNQNAVFTLQPHGALDERQKLASRQRALARARRTRPRYLQQPGLQDDDDDETESSATTTARNTLEDGVTITTTTTTTTSSRTDPLHHYNNNNRDYRKNVYPTVQYHNDDDDDESTHPTDYSGMLLLLDPGNQAPHRRASYCGSNMTTTSSMWQDNNNNDNNSLHSSSDAPHHQSNSARQFRTFNPSTHV